MTKTTLEARKAAHAALAAELAAMPDAALLERLRTAKTRLTSTGCPTCLLDLAGGRVFVKRLPLSRLELAKRPSTANYFDLPMVFHYGIDSLTFGAWRELAGLEMATRWVVAGTTPAFVMLHHHRVLPALKPSEAVSQKRRDEYRAYWENSEEVARRLDATGGATHELALFMEVVPHTLADWTHPHVSDPRAWAALFDSGRSALAAMRSGGMTHFDTHWENALTDGEQVYFIDFGLAVDADFELADDERRFLAAHAPSYDAALYARGLLGAMRRLISAGEAEPRGAALDAAMDALIAASDPAAAAAAAGAPPPLAALYGRLAPAATTMYRFMRAVAADKRTPYPGAALERVLAVQ